MTALSNTHARMTSDAFLAFIDLALPISEVYADTLVSDTFDQTAPGV